MIRSRLPGVPGLDPWGLAHGGSSKTLGCEYKYGAAKGVGGYESRIHKEVPIEHLSHS